MLCGVSSYGPPSHILSPMAKASFSYCLLVVFQNCDPSGDQHSRPYITYCCGKMKDTVERPKSLASEVLQRATKAAGHIRKMTLGKDQEVPFHIIRLKHVEDWRLFWTAISVTLLKLYIAYIIHIYTSVSVRLCFPRFLFLSSSFLYTFWHIW